MFRGLLAVILVFGVNLLMAQTDINLLRNQFNEAYDSGHFKTALTKADLIIDYWKSKNQKDSTAYYRYKRAYTIGQDGESEEVLRETDILISELEADPPLPEFMGDIYVVKGMHLIYLSEFAKAEEELNKAISYITSRVKPDTVMLAKAIEWKGIVYSYSDRLEAGQHLVEEALRLRYSICDSSSLQIGYTLNSLANLYYDRNMLAETDAAYEEAYRIFKLHLSADHPHVLTVAANLSNVKSSIGEIGAALELLEGAIAGHEKTKSVYNLLKEYHNLASVYYQSLNDEKRARTYFLKSLQLADSLLPVPHFYRANIYDGLGGTYLHEENYVKADSMFLMAYNERLRLPEKSLSDLGQSSYNLGLTSDGMGNIARASEYYIKSLKYLKESLGENHPKTANTLFALGELEWEAGKREEALLKFKKCLQIYTANLTSRHAFPLQSDMKLVRCYDAMNINDSTEFYLKKGWECVLGIPADSIHLEKLSNYPIKFVHTEVINLINLNLDLLINNQNLIGNKDNVKGKELIRTMDKLMAELWPMLNFDNGTSSLLTTIKHVYHKGVLLSSHYANESEDNKEIYLNSLEQSQSVSIRSALLNRNAMHYANVPDSMIEKDRQLREKLRFIQANVPDEQDADWDKLSFKALNDWRIFQIELQKNYPDWYAVRYDPEIPKLEDVKKELAKNNASLVAYFVADTATVIMVIDPDNFKIITAGLPPSWRDSVRTYRSLTEDRADAVRLGGLSHYLYSLFWEPIENQTRQKVMLISDGALNFLNFETLVSEKPISADFSKWDWLIKKHIFLYRNALPGKIKQKSSKNTEILALAPGFSDELKSQYRSMLDSGQSLDTAFTQWVQTPWSVEFAEELESKGKTFVGLNATKAAFRANASKANILHFGTHARLNDTKPLNSYLALTPQPENGDDGYLYAYELYNQPLKAQLAVLTACQTGLGVYREGDGVISIAHAFQYAGCPNVVYSLWQIDDKQSTWLMKSFYGHLDDNQYFSEALHNAKINYLENHSGELSAPYYWGGVILTGNDGKLTPDASFLEKYWWVILLAILISALLLVRLRKRDKTADLKKADFQF